jgi:hypothetical protein
MDVKTQLPNGKLLSTVLIEDTGVFESCWFFDNLTAEIPDSEVVEFYDSQDDALQGHINLLTQEMPSVDWEDTFIFLRDKSYIDMKVTKYGDASSIVS